MHESRCETGMEKLRRAGAEALRSHDVLMEVWRGLQESDIANATQEDVRLLESLIIGRIYSINAFDLLVKINPDAAIDVLLSRYLGRGVDPDRKFGGFEFELLSMLDDLLEVGGARRIAQLVSHTSFSTDRVEDLRVRRVFGEILQMEEHLVATWIHGIRNGDESH